MWCWASSRRTIVGGAALAVVAVVALTAVLGGNDDEDGSGMSRAIELQRSLDALPDDCSRPVEADLNRLLAAAPNGSTFKLRPGACYGIDQAVVLSNKQDFTLDGAGAVIKALTPGGEQRANIDVRRGTNVTVTDLTVEGAYPGPSADGFPGTVPATATSPGPNPGCTSDPCTALPFGTSDR